MIQSPKRLMEGEQESSALYSGHTLDGGCFGTQFDERFSQKSSFKYVPSTDKSILTNFENFEGRFKRKNFLPVVIESRKKEYLEQDSIFLPTPQPEAVSEQSPKRQPTQPKQIRIKIEDNTMLKILKTQA